jgi:hypothetical protein
VFVFLAVFSAIYLPVIRSEEAFLRERFPEFAEYERRVPRLFPRPGNLPAPSPTPGGVFSRELYLKHHEYEALAGTLAMAAFLAIKLFWFKR